MQMMAANLPTDRFHVTYFTTADHESASRRAYLEKAGVRCRVFRVGQRRLDTSDMRWEDTDFSDIFNEDDFDLIQCAKARGPEYPFHSMRKPVVEYRTLAGLPDFSSNIAFSLHLSNWQRDEWWRRGGSALRSGVIPIPAELPTVDANLREKLGIPGDAVVAGFHQRVDDAIYSPVPLEAYGRIQRPGWFFILMGGSRRYGEQAKRLGLRSFCQLPHSAEPSAVSEFLNTLDLFAHGRADGETFGAVFAEALMHGKPCLSHRSRVANAQQETIGPAGVMTDESPRDYAKALHDLLSDPEWRRRLAAKARSHAERFFSLKPAVDALGDLYESLLGSRTSHLLPATYRLTAQGFFCGGSLAREWPLPLLADPRSDLRRFAYFTTVRQARRAVRMIYQGSGLDWQPWLALHSAPSLRATLVASDQAALVRMQEMIWLNNWEARVAISLGTATHRSELSFDGSRAESGSALISGGWRVWFWAAKAWNNTCRAGWLLPKALRHPRRGLAGLARWRGSPAEGWRF